MNDNPFNVQWEFLVTDSQTFEGISKTWFNSESIETDCFLLSGIYLLPSGERLNRDMTICFIDTNGNAIDFGVLEDMQYIIVTNTFRGIMKPIPSIFAEVKLTLGKEGEERLRHLFDYGE